MIEKAAPISAFAKHEGIYAPHQYQWSSPLLCPLVPNLMMEESNPQPPNLSSVLGTRTFKETLEQGKSKPPIYDGADDSDRLNDMGIENMPTGEEAEEKNPESTALNGLKF